MKFRKSLVAAGACIAIVSPAIAQQQGVTEGNI